MIKFWHCFIVSWCFWVIGLVMGALDPPSWGKFLSGFFVVLAILSILEVIKKNENN